MEDDGRMVKMRKLGNEEINNNERLFEEKRTNIKYKKRNRVYTMHGWDCKRKSDPNPHTNHVFYASPRPSDA